VEWLPPALPARSPRLLAGQGFQTAAPNRPILTWRSGSAAGRGRWPSPPHLQLSSLNPGRKPLPAWLWSTAACPAPAARNFWIVACARPAGSDPGHWPASGYDRTTSRGSGLAFRRYSAPAWSGPANELESDPTIPAGPICWERPWARMLGPGAQQGPSGAAAQ